MTYNMKIIKKNLTLIKSISILRKTKLLIILRSIMSTIHKNTYEMKKARIRVLLKNPNCDICGKEAKIVHHKDDSLDNHNIDNLIPLCYSCRMKLHLSFSQTVDYDIRFIKIELLKKYGNKKNISRKENISPYIISALFNNNKISDKSAQKISKILNVPFEQLVIK